MHDNRAAYCSEMKVRFRVHIRLAYTFFDVPTRLNEEGWRQCRQVPAVAITRRRARRRNATRHSATLRACAVELLHTAMSADTLQSIDKRLVRYVVIVGLACTNMRENILRIETC